MFIYYIFNLFSIVNYSTCSFLVPEIHCVTGVSSRKRFFSAGNSQPHFGDQRPPPKSFWPAPIQVAAHRLFALHGPPWTHDLLPVRDVPWIPGASTNHIKPKTCKVKRPDMSTKYVNIKPKKKHTPATALQGALEPLASASLPPLQYRFSMVFSNLFILFSSLNPLKSIASYLNFHAWKFS